jgi:stage II sporulation protein P
MISIGKHLAQCLEKQGVSVIHDTTVHDYPSYNDAYKLSRQTVQRYLEQYPTISLVLDIHRDAYEDSDGNQLSSTVSIDGVTASKLMIVAGTNGYDEGHPDWRENLSVAVKLHAVLEKSYPGLCRSLAIRSSAFNQDLSPGSLLIEVGTAGDTRQQALAAAEFLADGIAQLSQGSQ